MAAVFCWRHADITRRAAVDRADLGISLVPEGRQFFSDLTVDENLTVGGYARPVERDAAKRERVFGYFPRLVEAARPDWPARCPAASSRCSRLAAP